MSSNGNLVCSIEGCGGHSKLIKGYCSAHYQRLRRHGSALGGGVRLGAPMAFLQDVVLTSAQDACLVWPFARTLFGYGRIRKDGRAQLVHRLVCEDAHGEPGDDRMAIHTCGKGHAGCVNPRHIRWGSPKQNQDDRVRDGTSNRGERCAAAKLSEVQARDIKSRLAGGERCADLSREFGVSFVTVHDIKTGRSWKWLELAA